jgi:subtilisin family serine protease
MSKRTLTTLLSAIAVSAAAALSVPTATLVAAPSAEAGKSSSEKAVSSKFYIVRLAESPVTAYKGGIKGYPATKPATGKKIDPTSSKVVNYMSYLSGRHDAVLAAAGGGSKAYSYGYVFNGFAAELTQAQAEKIRSMPGVVSVEKDVIVEADTSSTPSFLGLDAPGGLWEQLGGVGSAGENIIIGIIDSGIWPENLSFSDRTGVNGNASKDGKLAYQQIPGWHGKCTPGEAFNASLCNQKLIGAQHFNAGQGGDAGINEDRPWEFASVRDYNGHGTHTASTAGGNHNVDVTGPGDPLGSVSGMAPRARIAMYKALWSTEDTVTASGSGIDLLAAIDTAVADGVDVINYSISGTTTNFADGVEIAFLFAADAGVFVAASAGNSGPATGTVAHPSPWITTVAAGTHNRSGDGSVTLGNGATYLGASLASATGPAPFIDSTAAGLPGADPTEVALCYAAIDNGGVAVLDPAKVAGKIVLCDRGVTARVNKSLAVQEAGGVGSVLANTSDSSINADFHVIPTVHVSHLDRPALKAYAATPGATATINASQLVFDVDAPFTAAFSSRGPLTAGGGDLLKPDVIAPGQDILAAYSPAFGGLDFNQISGTSMSSPHVAGLAALLMDRHPSWTPMMIKSALMTSAYDVLDGPNTNPLVIFRQGAGHVRPNTAADPGLVYTHGFNDWLAFLCGTTTAVNPASCTALQGAGFSLDPSNLNVASIAIGDLVHSQTVKRRVTNVGSSPATYRASLTSMTGFTNTIAPNVLTLNPGQTGSFEVTFQRTSATLNAYSGGQLTWTEDGGAGHVVRIPVVVRPLPLLAPAEVSSTGGPISYDVKFGFDGPFTAVPRGLVPATTRTASVQDDPTDSNCSLTTPNAVIEPVTIPADTTYARFALFDEFTDAPDLDLCVFNSAGTRVANSGGATSAETANLLNPAAGEYRVVVAPFDTGGPSATFTLFKWVLGSAAAGNMTVTAPATAVTGATGTINLSFSGLTAGTKYLGSVVYSGVAGLPNPTIVRVDP